MRDFSGSRRKCFLRRCRAVVSGAVCISIFGCGAAPSSSARVEPVVVIKAPVPALPPYLIHLPGIGGKRSIDVAMTRGLKQWGFVGQIEIYDWTETDAGLASLISSERNHKEARLIAQKITERFDRDPGSVIDVTCHSGGGGIAIWALEALPDRVKVATLVLMSPALSPRYDLSKALRHVSGKAYVFSSTEDVLVLGTGCKLFGTIDGVKCNAAGMVGFVMPAGADAGQYEKLVAMPYNPDWMQFDDYGNHVGGMTRLFGQFVLGPLIVLGKLPAVRVEKVPATLP